MQAPTLPVDLPRAAAREICRHRVFFWSAGILSIAFGTLAILIPQIAALAAELVIGAVLALAGLSECVLAFRGRGAARVAAGFLLGLVALAAGALLLLYPLPGLVALTVFLVAFFVVTGLLKLYFAWTIRPSNGWAWMAFGGLVSLALGALIWSGLPGTAAWLLGLLVGVDMILYGFILIGTVKQARKAVSNGPGDVPTPRG